MNKRKNDILTELEKTVIEKQDWLFRFAYMRIGCRTDAEDVVQDVFLKLLGKLRNENHVKDMELYIIRCVSNACNDFLRRKQPKFCTLETVTGLSVNDNDKQMQEEFIRINRLLNGLPYEQA